ncbi:ABC transporter permease [Eupransor demetentiae]|uniref:Permease component (YadH) n=1 Tax=Eupransor demetentiae TaxID=3109584 RepID=A0ABP0EQP7_9LACO|nr:ABC-type multidrug transport system [Lactobacillaceae bacterium LMG 33000]
MTRTWAIAKRTFIELIRDKRTLAMMLLAPVLILTLVNYIFSVNTTTNVKIGTVQVEQALTQPLDKTKHVSTKSYESDSAAKKALKDQKIDAVLTQKDSKHFNVLYANTEASKTSLTRAALNSALIQNKIGTLSQVATQAVMQNSSEAAALKQQTKLSESYSYGDKNTNFFASIMPIFIAFFVFMFVFLISGISLLKERTSGTLSRLLATPVRRSEIIYGYMLSYGILAVVMTAVIVFYSIFVLNIQVVGSIWSLFAINIVLAMVALALGLLISTLAASEFQMIQFIPLVIVPQIIFSGMIPLDGMATWAQVIGDILPLKYAATAMQGVILHGDTFVRILPQLGILLIFLVVLLAANIRGLRRYRKV